VPRDQCFQYNSVLLVYDWYYVQVYWRGLTPVFSVTDCWFMTSILCSWRGLVLILQVQLHFTGLRLVLCASLLKGPRFHTSSNRLLVSN
jgi:hypothetical protein